MKHPLLFLPLTLAILTSATFAERPVGEEVLWDGFHHISRLERSVHDVVEVKRNPLFDNAPFLRLRGDDKLVQALEADSQHKGYLIPAQVKYYLLSDGHFYLIETKEESGNFSCRKPIGAPTIACFSTGMSTLENAQAAAAK
ncbi:hypothetical protein CfE428DRAFT_0025 [Chthoniobacter flavus Ellin428]|uniref:Uncharacterized protein n=1 Tax=Chthoniobacter flavus Ellin428 TaxID=497964 RepID=B4CV87_9BACT|nr:hypothetical protein [Chthoniobacter flavus]EDY21900.1 hypothetical protein CfE428DRAFT_0025 [Chthoniobacter flavus Ellin428]